MVFLWLCNLPRRYQLAPKIKAESTLQAQWLPYLTVGGPEMSKLSSSFIRLKQMGGLFLGYYNIGTYACGHVLEWMPDEFTKLAIIKKGHL